MTKNIDTPKKVLAVFAHPDDMDFSSSGTMAKWAASGTEITYLVCTDGSKGSEDIKMTPEKLEVLRREEQETAADILGVKRVLFLGHKDGELLCDLQLKEQICRAIREAKPEVVVTLDPTFLYSTKRGFVNHTDHRATGLATMDAVFPLARDRLNFPEHMKAGLEPHKTKTLFFVSFDEPEHFEDISDFLEKKKKAIYAHTSQAPEVIEPRIRERCKALGEKGGMEYAEGFKRIDIE